MYIPKEIIDYFFDNGLFEKYKIYREYNKEIYPPFDNTCTPEEYMEKLDKAISEIKEKENNND